jgi:hypothetical protein
VGKHNHKNQNNRSNAPKTKSPGSLGGFGGFNIGDLLKNIDLNQIISLLSTFVGAKNMNTNQLSSMIRNLDLNDVNKENTSPKMDIDKLKSQLSVLADRLDEVEGGKGNNVHDELMKAVKNLQETPDMQDALNNFIKSNLIVADKNNNEKRKTK